MRIAFVSPLPPERTGIGDYSYELLEELRHLVDVTAVVRDDLVTVDRVPEGVELVGISALDDLVFDCTVYQMGNNSKYHRYLFGRALDEPGLLVLHDPSLADFHAEMCGRPDSSIFREEIAYDSPDIGLDDDLPLVDVGNGRRDLDRLRVLLARRMIDSSIRTLVNSEAMAIDMRQRYPGNEIHAIQLPAPLLEDTSRRPRGDRQVVFGVFGGINYYKRVRPLVDAFTQVHREFPLAKMVIAGRADDPILEREIRAVAARPELGGALEILTDLPLTDLEREMTRCDVGISLRWPTAGEMSATLMRTLGAGRPAIVSDVPQFRELDERFCWRVPVDFDLEHDALVGLMRRVAADPERCRRAGEEARRFVEREATYRIVAENYIEHLRECVPRRAAKLGMHLPSNLGTHPVLGVNLVRCASVGGEVHEAANRVVAVLRATGVDVVLYDLEPMRGAGDRADIEETAASESACEDEDGDLVPDTELRGVPFRRIRHPAWALRSARAAGPHRVDVYMLDHVEIARVIRLARARFARGRRIIPFLAPLAAPLAPQFTPLFAIAEEIWAPSRFGVEAVRLSTTVPAVLVPWMAADSSVHSCFETDDEERKTCVFLTVVDGNDFVASSNPRAAIAAFRRAIAPRARRVIARLVVVTSHLDDEVVLHLREEVEAAAGELVEDPDAAELRRLLEQCDVYVSLHRASAFGTRIADAMALGKPVVATAYSGNLDLMSEVGAGLVGYDVRRLHPGDLFLTPGAVGCFSPGQLWAEPDVEDAARSLRRLVEAPELRERLGAQARRAAAAYSGEVVGSVTRAALLRATTSPSRERTEQEKVRRGTPSLAT